MEEEGSARITDGRNFGWKAEVTEITEQVLAGGRGPGLGGIKALTSDGIWVDEIQGPG